MMQKNPQQLVLRSKGGLFQDLLSDAFFFFFPHLAVRNPFVCFPNHTSYSASTVYSV